MKIGARIVKTGIAVTITMYICKMFNLEPAFFGAVSAVVNMQPSIFLTIKTARDQILIHILGVGAGLVFGYLVGGSPIIMGLVTILIILLQLKFHLQSGITTGIVAALFILGSSQEEFLPHALGRTGVIFVGLITAMIINVVIWPPRYKKQFKKALVESHKESVAYFYQAVMSYVQLGDQAPAPNKSQQAKVQRLNKEARSLASLLKHEGGPLAPAPSVQAEWFVIAEKLIDYNETLAERSDRIYYLLSARYERRQKAGYPPISEEFKAILDILATGCTATNRVNEKLRLAVLDRRQIGKEQINEDYWERLTIAIEHWHHKLTGSYYMHALIEAAVTANEIKWATREAKKLLYETILLRDKER